MIKKIQYLILIFLFNSTYLIAQDAHYWTEQFGNRSMLLSGSVIGSVEDLGTVFYNPSRLASEQTSSFLISAKALQLVTIKVKDGIGKADLSNNRFGSTPTLIAGSFDFKKVK